MNHLIVFLISLLAFGCLAMAMERHQDEVLRYRPRALIVWTLRAFGWLMLAMALMACMLCACSKWALCLVAWFGHMSFAAGTVFTCLMAIRRLTSR